MKYQASYTIETEECLVLEYESEFSLANDIAVFYNDPVAFFLEELETEEFKHLMEKYHLQFKDNVDLAVSTAKIRGQQ